MKPSDSSTVLLVSADGGAALERLADELRRCGAETLLRPDVYSAMACLVQRPEVRAVALDVRRLDDEELAFVRLAARYFPEVKVLPLDLPGAKERMQRYGQIPALQSLETARAALVQEPRMPLTEGQECGISGMGDALQQAATQETVETPLSSATALTTVEAAPPSAVEEMTPGSAGPSMEEAVRQRMAGGTIPRVQRRPPGSVSPGNGSTPPDGSDASHLSSEEMDALLRQEEAEG